MLFKVGDIVQRTDIRGRKRYVVTHLATDQSGWVYTRELGGGRGGTITFLPFMLKKVG